MFKLPKSPQNGGAEKDAQKSGSQGISRKSFSQFVNCGQYRDKSKNLFDCKNVKIPKPGASTSGPGASTSEPGASTSGPGASTPGPGASTSGTGASTSGPGASTSGPGASTSGPGASTPGTTGSPEKASGTGSSWWNNPFGKSKGPTGSPGSPGSPGITEAANIPTATATPVNSNNIELEINEKDFDGTLKRVDVSIFIPTDGEVIVRNYAKNNARETLRGLPVYGIPN